MNCFRQAFRQGDPAGNNHLKPFVEYRRHIILFEQVSMSEHSFQLEQPRTENFQNPISWQSMEWGYLNYNRWAHLSAGVRHFPSFRWKHCRHKKEIRRMSSNGFCRFDFYQIKFIEFDNRCLTASYKEPLPVATRAFKGFKITRHGWEFWFFYHHMSSSMPGRSFIPPAPLTMAGSLKSISAISFSAFISVA